MGVGVTCGGFLAFVEGPAHLHRLAALLDLLLDLAKLRPDLDREETERRQAQSKPGEGPR